MVSCLHGLFYNVLDCVANLGAELPLGHVQGLIHQEVQGGLIYE